MSSGKKTAKSKFLPVDIDKFKHECEFIRGSSKIKTPQKRQNIIYDFDEDISQNVIGYNAKFPKQRKIHEEPEEDVETKHKILNKMNRLLESRKHMNNNFQKSLSEVINKVEADYNILKENEQKIEYLAGLYIKNMQQTTSAYKQKLETLKEIYHTFKKTCDDMDTEYKAQLVEIGDELEEDLTKLKDNIVSETKRNGWDSLLRSLLQVMQKDF